MIALGILFLGAAGDLIMKHLPPNGFRIPGIFWAEHGQVCFSSPPSTEIELGSYVSFMIFDQSVCFRNGGWYFIAAKIPFISIFLLLLAASISPFVLSDKKHSRARTVPRSAN